MSGDSSLPENKLTLSLQAFLPSNHVCSVFELPLAPQFLNQAPPGAQQLCLPDFLMVPHLGHMGPIAFITVVAVTADVVMWVLRQQSRPAS